MIRKIAFGIASVAIAFSFTGCSDNSANPTAVVTVTQTPEPEQFPVDPFIKMLQDDTDDFDYETDEAILGLSDSICQAFGRDASFGQMASILLDNGVTPYDAGYFIGASVSAFCPEFMYKLPESNAHGI